MFICKFQTMGSGSTKMQMSPTKDKDALTVPLMT
jgi:hypothetical protein